MIKCTKVKIEIKYMRIWLFIGDKHYTNERDEVHNENGPAICEGQYNRYWYKNGLIHRVDGPCSEQANYLKWGLLGVIIPRYRFNSWIKRIKVLFDNKDKNKSLFKEKFINGSLRYKEEANSKEWFLNGKRHRLNGPALLWSSGEESWFFNGELHREGGPAIHTNDGNDQWWLFDKKYTKEEYDKIIGNGF